MKAVLPLLCWLYLMDSLRGGMSASFYGDSSVRLPFDDSTPLIRLELRFLTSRPDGLLFMAKGQTDWLLLRMTSGQLMLQGDFGSGAWLVTSDPGPGLDDLTWHHVVISQSGKTMALSVDTRTYNGSLPGGMTQLNENEVLVGGFGNWKNFRGCITNVIFNRYNILNHAQQLNNSDLVKHVTWDCSEEFTAPSNEPIYFKDDQSYLALPGLTITTTGSLYFDVKTLSQTTFLVISLSTNLTYSDVLAIELINGKIKLTVNRGGGDTFIRSAVTVNDNQWHNVGVTFESQRVILTVDTERQQSAFHRNSNNFFRFADKFYIGGLTNDIRHHISNQNLLADSRITGNFRGCVRSVNVEGNDLGFKNVEVSNEIEVGCKTGQVEIAPNNGGTGHVDESSNRERPLVSVVPLRAREGEEVTLTGSVIRVVFDYRAYRIRQSAIQFRITQPPDHGSIEIDRRRSNDAFTLLDLIGRKVKYAHDGSETVSDEVAMEMVIVSGSDSVPEKLTQTYAFVLPVVISPVNDPPILYLLNKTSTTTRIDIAKESKIEINTNILNLDDPDTSALNSVFSVKCNSTSGVAGHMEVQGQPVDSFTFQQVLDGVLLFSVHQVPTNCTFNISSIIVTSIFIPQDLKLTLTKKTGIRLVHGSFSLIQPENLTVSTNLPYQNLDIQYVISRNPRYGEIQKNDNGIWTTITRFTQEDIEKGNIRYTNSRSVHSTPYDQFSFTVRCLTKSLDQTPFFIQIERQALNVNFARSINLSRKDYKVLSKAELHAQTNDKMTSDVQIRFMILRPPVYGSIYRVHKTKADPDLLSDLQPLQRDEHFTQDDVNNGYVIYKLKSSTSRRTGDFVDLSVESGSAVPKRIRIYFDYTPPVSAVRFTNNGLKTVIEGRQRTIERSDLYLETNDYSEFEFDVIDFPEHGELQLVIPRTSHVESRNVSKFTNQDIRNLKLVYEHDDSESDTDRFTFIASPILQSTDVLPLKVQEFSGTFQIKIIMRNDNAPRRPVDKIFHVVTNQEKVITLDDLSCTDPDINFDPMNLLYTVGRVRNGDIINNVNKSVVTRFTQKDIADGKITFRHRGARVGRIPCYVGDGQYNTQFVFEVEATNPYLRIVNNTGVAVKASQSVFITSNNLSIETNMNTEPKDIRFILVQEPLYGNLELIGAKVTEFSLQIILDGVLSYRHRGQGGNEDVFRFAVFAGQARAQSSFVIHIFQTTQNVPPRIVHNSILEVPELGFSTLTTNNLQVTHPNSPPSSIIYTVTAPPSHGRLRVQGRYHRQGDHAHQTFTQENIDQGHISYHHSDFNPSADSFVFDVTNGMQTLKGLQFAIEIIPTRLELEIQNFTVQEGMRKALTKNNIRLKSRYYDSKTITFTVVKQPGHGWLEEAGRRGQRLTTFTFAQLSQGRVYYLHDNSESLSDSFTVRGRVEEEGKDSREGVVYVSIQTINDQSPTVVINRQLKMWRSSLALITKEHLRADDSDSSPTEITYQVLSTTNGRVAFVNNAFRSIQSFNQEQVNRNQVVFVHDGDDEGGFMFYVTDGTNTDHKRENFNVLAEPLTLTLVKNSPLKVYPGRGHTITPQNLLTKTNDLNQTKPIIYHVLQKPKKGRIVTMYKDRALEVMSFKQEDINDGKIIYQHDAYLTKWTDHDNFTFEVRTLYAADIQNMMFKIQISYGNFQNQNQNDDIHVEGFVVQEGGSHVLSKQNIDATNYTRQQENNGKRARIWFSLLSKPMNGELYKGGRIISRGDRFLQSEINDGQISYQHDNSDTSNDSFVFNVHVEIQQAGKKEVEVQEMKGTFYISVLPLNDQPFRILSVNPVIQVVEGMSTVVSSDILKTVDLDTPPGGITYNVKTLPSNGILGYSGNSMQQIRQFTQKDIDDGKVTFTQHGSKQRGSFEVEVSDGKFPANSTSVSVSVVPITLHVTSNRTIYILQADTSVYITKDNLDISTNGNRQKIHYEIKIPPKYGQIFQLVYPVTFFKQVDIDKRNILYIQRNLSSHMDYFFCDIYYEGSSAVLRNKRVIVMVKPLVKQQPITSTIGGRTPVTTKNLDASQLANITGYTPRYTIIERPKFGHIVKIVRSRRDTNGRSQYKEVDQFTHEDVLYVRIYYVPQNFQFVREVEDSFSYLLSSRGVQPALGKMTLRVAPYPGYTTPRGGGRSHFDKPNADKNSTLFSEEPDRGEIVSPNVSPDFIIILAILIPLFVLVIFIIVIVFILWRRQRFRRYSPPGSGHTQRKSHFRPDISGPVTIEQPHVHIQLQDGTTAPDDSHSLLYEHHNYLNVPIKSDGKHYANAEIGQGHSDADDLDSDSDNESNVISPLVDPDMTEISATVPECKVTPLLGAKRRPKEKDSGCDMDLFDWSMIEDPEFLQHCRTTTPVLKDNQYWV